MPLRKGSSPAIVKDIPETDLAYIAGLFDGEGCVSFGRVRSSYFIRIFVTNTNLDILEWLKSLFGGDIKKNTRKEGWKQGYVWRLSWSRAINFLALIEPWLRIKEDQAHLAFCWNHFRPGKGVRYISSEKREEYKCDIDYLRECLTYFNKRGEHNLEDPVQKALFPCH